MAETKKFIFGSLNYMLPFCPIGRSELFPCESTFHRKAFIIGVRCFKESFISQDRNEHQAFQRRWSWGHVYERSNKPTPEASILQKVQILLLPIKKTGRTKYPYSKISGKILVDEAVGMGFWTDAAPLPWVHSITTSLDKKQQTHNHLLEIHHMFSHFVLNTVVLIPCKKTFNHNVSFGKEDLFATTENLQYL